MQKSNIFIYTRYLNEGCGLVSNDAMSYECEIRIQQRQLQLIQLAIAIL